MFRPGIFFDLKTSGSNPIIKGLIRAVIFSYAKGEQF